MENSIQSQTKTNTVSLIARIGASVLYAISILISGIDLITPIVNAIKYSYFVDIVPYLFSTIFNSIVIIFAIICLLANLKKVFVAYPAIKFIVCVISFFSSIIINSFYNPAMPILITLNTLTTSFCSFLAMTLLLVLVIACFKEREKGILALVKKFWFVIPIIVFLSCASNVIYSAIYNIIESGFNSSIIVSFISSTLSSIFLNIIPLALTCLWLVSPAKVPVKGSEATDATNAETLAEDAVDTPVDEYVAAPIEEAAAVDSQIESSVDESLQAPPANDTQATE